MENIRGVVNTVKKINMFHVNNLFPSMTIITCEKVSVIVIKQCSKTLTKFSLHKDDLLYSTLLIYRIPLLYSSTVVTWEGLQMVTPH